MPLEIVDEGYEGWGVYIGGYTIAPDVLLIRAESFETAWEAMIDRFAEKGSIDLCEHDSPEDEESCLAHDYGSSGGPYCTLDLTLRVVRSGRGD